MEMNTRIQVEHPVTEMITGLDLISEQIRIAQGERLRFKQSDIIFKGHAIECRINAEDPEHNFRPNPGRISAYLPPGGPGVRMDSHVYTDYDIPPYYDSLIGKLIVWAPDRATAIRRMKRALRECAITGIPTTIEFHRKILDVPEFLAGDVYTNFIEEQKNVVRNLLETNNPFGYTRESLEKVAGATDSIDIVHRITRTVLQECIEQNKIEDLLSGAWKESVSKKIKEVVDSR
jgi:acetyl-CoA carboxylase biotin carboxylase subunit